MSPSDLSPPFDTILTGIEDTLLEKGFSFLRAEVSRPLLEHAGLSDWQGFAESWSHLGLDRYMADGGRYRRRRYATFAISGDVITRKKHQPHYQSRDYNLLNGGVERWFPAVTDSVASHPAMTAAIRTISTIADALTPPTEKPPSWHVEVHQFRIEARTGNEGRPTPEGLHRDGVDWVLVLMVSRHNVEQGVTTIHDMRKNPLGSFTLTNPLDAAIVDDHRVYHGVTAVQPVDPTQPAYRDVLVVTLRHE
ncbi:2OG-Fe dioxygenase family protein [Gluconobacter kanchanaburiensis]|nr:2OG-Fe dioxygenase family protein [Gluconobacter kanchanaburiensis]MBF0860948.1 2OG-Fe dioxygenase family protein [Gluconobacter kanchanaburiensis]